MRISDWSSDVCSSDLHGHHVLSVRQRLLNVETASIRHVQVEDDAAGHCLVHHFEEVGSRCVALHCKARHTEHETGPFANSLLIIDEVYDALVPHSSPDKGSGYGVQLSADFMGASRSE